MNGSFQYACHTFCLPNLLIHHDPNRSMYASNLPQMHINFGTVCVTMHTVLTMIPLSNFINEATDSSLLNRILSEHESPKHQMCFLVMLLYALDIKKIKIAILPNLEALPTIILIMMQLK